MWHVYIKPPSPQLNGKLELSHITDQAEFYQLLTYTDNTDVNVKLKARETPTIMIDLIYPLMEKHLIGLRSLSQNSEQNVPQGMT